MRRRRDVFRLNCLAQDDGAGVEVSTRRSVT